MTLTPLTRRRIANFRANRRGYWAAIIFAVIFVLTLFAEFIANDRPFLIKFDGRLYFPAFVTYAETTFGGDFETAADYRDPYLQKLIAEFDPAKVYHLAQRNFYGFLNMEEKSGSLMSITGDFPDIPKEKRLWLGTKVFSISSIPKEGTKTTASEETT